MGVGTAQPMGQQGQQYTPGTFGPQNPQGAMALQNAYHQFNTSAPPQPNPMFGQQPVGNLQGAPLGGGMAQQPMGHAGDFNPITRQFTPGGAPLGGVRQQAQPMTQQQQQQQYEQFMQAQQQQQQQGLPQYPQPVFNPSTQQPAYQPGIIPGQDFARQQQMGGGMQPQGMQQLGQVNPQFAQQPQAFDPLRQQMLQQMQQQRAMAPYQQAQPMRQPLAGGMPMAPATQQTRPEDPRMAAMRYMQQMKLGEG
jgi:hypothetical protein